MRCAAAAILILLGGQQALADGMSRVGNFTIQTEKDRFGGHDTAVASIQKGFNVLYARCLKGGLDLAYGEASLGQGRWEEGMKAHVMIRVDDHPVVEADADGINDKMIEIDGVEDVLRSMIGAREIALRIEARGIIFDQVFPLKLSAKAVPVILKACNEPLTAPHTPPPSALPAPAEPVAQAQPAPTEASPVTPATPAPADSASNEATLSATLHRGLDVDDRERFAKIVQAFVVSKRCDGHVNTDVLVDSIASAGPKAQLFDGLAIAEGLALMATRMNDDAQWPTNISADDRKAYCDSARSAFGDGGTTLARAVAF